MWKSTLQWAWQGIAIAGIIASCVASGATPFIYALSLVGILFVLGVALKRPSSQLLGAIFCVLLGIISWEQGLIANSLLNILMLSPLCVYGYTVWKKGVSSNSLEKSLSLPQATALGVASAVGTGVLWWFTKGMESSVMPFLDSLTAVGIFVATIIMTLSYKEQWIAWIIVNISQCYIWWVAMQSSNEVASVFSMKVIFLLNSLIGWWNWNKCKKSD